MAQMLNMLNRTVQLKQLPQRNEKLLIKEEEIIKEEKKMAGITGSYVAPNGVTYANAYAMICSYDRSCHVEEFNFKVTVWRTETSYDNDEAPIDDKIPTFVVHNLDGSTDFTNYFTRTVLDDAGKDPEERAEQYLIDNVAAFSGWTKVA